MTTETTSQFVSPFNGPIEIGLRALCILTTAFPTAFPLQRLVVYDYLLVHSDDFEGGPTGLHPQTPHRGGEILVRRGVLQDGLTLYESRGLVERVYNNHGIFFSANDRSADFLDTLCTHYIKGLRERADWIVDRFDSFSDRELESMVRNSIGIWGAEFSMESVLWFEDAP